MVLMTSHFSSNILNIWTFGSNLGEIYVWKGFSHWTCAIGDCTWGVVLELTCALHEEKLTWPKPLWGLNTWECWLYVLMFNFVLGPYLLQFVFNWGVLEVSMTSWGWEPTSFDNFTEYGMARESWGGESIQALCLQSCSTWLSLCKRR